MRPVVVGSLVLAAAVTVVSAIFYATGFHQSFIVSQVVFLVLAIVINVVVVLAVLRRTAAENGYGKQLLGAAGIGLLGGLLIVGLSWLLLAVVFPDVLPEYRVAAIAFMERSGMPAEEVERQRAMIDSATPFSQSLPALFGTFLTSVASGAIIAIWKRRPRA